MPKASLTNSAYILDNTGGYSQTGSFLRIVNATTINQGIMNSAIANYIDGKIDDGVPNRGNVYTNVGSNYSLPSCVTLSEVTYSYSLSDNQNSCQMWFYLY